MLIEDQDFVDEVVNAAESVQSDILLADRIKRLVKERKSRQKVTDNRTGDLLVGENWGRFAHPSICG